MRKQSFLANSLAIALALSTICTPVYAAQSGGAFEKVSVNPENGAANFIAGTLTEPSQKSAHEIVFSFLADQEGVFLSDDGGMEDFEILSETTDELGITNIKLQQLHDGIPVFGSVLSAHVGPDGTLTSISGEAAQGLPDLQLSEKSAALDSSGAAAIVSADLAGKLGAEPEIIAEEKPELVIFLDKGKAKLAYSSRIEFLNPEPGNHHYVVDASSGAILNSYNQIHLALPKGTDSVSKGKGVLGDSKQLNTLKNKEGSFLVDRTRGKGVLTYDAKQQALIPGALWIDTDGTFNAAYDGAAVDAHVYAGQTFDYFKDVHGRNSYDGKGAQIVSTVHYGKGYNNAFWSGSQMVYGDGDGTTYIPFSGALDVVAHELSHAVTASTANLLYQGDSGAINESMSDIFGTLVEEHFGNRPDWMIGEDIITPKQKGDALRSLADPTVNGNPDHYTKRYMGTDDYGGVHTNSSIPNKAAYLLANGGNHFNVSVKGIGNSKTGDIFYRTLTQYLTPNTTFSQLRAAAIQAATDLYGASSSEVASVKAAFSAVGIK